MPSNPFKKPKAPKAPEPVDPTIAINAEARANRFNTVTPGGTTTWTGDPSRGMTQTTRLDPSSQRQLNTQNRIAETMLTNVRPEANRLTRDPFTFDNQGSKAADALFAREKSYLDPEREYQSERLDQKMANMGLPMGSEAYGEETRRFDQNWNDAYTRAAQTSQMTGADLAQRERMQRFNELAAAMGGDQVLPQATAGPIDAGGAYARQQAAQNQAYQGQMAGYNANVAGQNNMWSGLMGLGGQLGAAYMLGCDRALKWAIRETGQVIGDLKLYLFKYLGSDVERSGFMADEVQALYPHAVSMSPGGFLQVHYGSIF